LTNNIAPLEDIAISLDREITGRVYETCGLTEKIGVVEALLLRRMIAKEERGASLQNAISGIVRSGGQISVDQLAGDMGISGRQLERRFLSEVGIGPKLLCRILRFQQVWLESFYARLKAPHSSINPVSSARIIPIHTHCADWEAASLAIIR
jgi:hypothetical protein